MDTNSDQRAQNQAAHNGMAAEAAPVLTKENSASIDVDDVWHYLGRFGRYQVISILWLALAMWPQSISILSGVFVGECIPNGPFFCVLSVLGPTTVASAIMAVFSSIIGALRR